MSLVVLANGLDQSLRRLFAIDGKEVRNRRSSTPAAALLARAAPSATRASSRSD